MKRPIRLAFFAAAWMAVAAGCEGRPTAKDPPAERGAATIATPCASDQVRCPDGACAKRGEDCLAVTGCPRSRPVRCSDDTCVRALVDCPGGAGLLRTPRPRACSPRAPIRCWDDTCVRAKMQCPPRPRE